MFGIPGVSVAAPGGLLRKETGPFGEAGLVGGGLLTIILISAHATKINILNLRNRCLCGNTCFEIRFLI